jgi:hypothetical protein
MKYILLNICMWLGSSLTLFAQQEYTHPTTGCGINYYYDYKGNRVARQFHCLNECPCPQNPDCNCGQAGRLMFKKPVVTVDSISALSTIKLYPNPTLEKFSIQFTTDFKNTTITVLTNAGQQVSTQVATCNKMDYNLTGLPAGIYYVVVNANNQSTKYKVVKIND